VLGIWDFRIRISKQVEGRISFLWERLSSRDLEASTISAYYLLLDVKWKSGDSFSNVTAS